MTDLYAQAQRMCESPSEQIMLQALMGFRPQCADPDADGSMLLDHPHLRIMPQFCVGPYRLDFAVLVTIPNVPQIKVDVECDGHAFHHATPEQVQRDHERARYLKERGWCVERYTGSEIAQSADGCVRKLERAIDAEFAKLVLAAAEHGWHRAA